MPERAVKKKKKTEKNKIKRKTKLKVTTTGKMWFQRACPQKELWTHDDTRKCAHFQSQLAAPPLGGRLGGSGSSGIGIFHILSILNPASREEIDVTWLSLFTSIFMGNPHQRGCGDLAGLL